MGMVNSAAYLFSFVLYTFLLFYCLLRVGLVMFVLVVE